jgi:hypothetical protein
MACDFSALANIDTDDPDQALALAQQCESVLTDPNLWMWAVGLTVVGAVVGALIGRRKNTVLRDALLGATLGPIGWIISVFLPAPKPRPVCPACARAVDASDAHCRNCGTKL